MKLRYRQAVGILTADSDRLAPWREPDAWKAGLADPLTPEQEEVVRLYEAGVTEIGLGGNPGGGKSYIVARLCIRYALEHPGSIIRVVRFQYKALNESTWPHFLNGVKCIADAYGLRYSHSLPRNEIRLMNGLRGSPGSSIIGLATGAPDLADRLGGTRFDVMFVDEANENARSIMGWLAERHRGSDASGGKWPIILFCAANPSHGWMKADYYDPWRRGELGKVHKEVWPDGSITIKDYSHRAYVPMRWEDNPGIAPGYRDRALAMDPSALRKARFDGDWDAMPGLVYQFEAPRVARIFDVERLAGMPIRELPLFGGYDWGHKHAAAIGVGVILETEIDGAKVPRFFMFDEYVLAGRTIADHIRWMLKYPHATWYADRTVFDATGHLGKQEGRSFIQEFVRAGLRIYPANEAQNYRIEKGVAIVQKRLAFGQIIIHERACPRTIQGLSEHSYKVDGISGLAIPGKFADNGKDVADVIRYLMINLDGQLAMPNEETFRPTAPTSGKVIASAPIDFNINFGSARRRVHERPHPYSGVKAARARTPYG